MTPFKLLMPHEVIQHWDHLSALLAPAITPCDSEISADDIRSLVLSGRMFVFATDTFALTCEFVVYPRKTVMNVAFGGGSVDDRPGIAETLTDFAKRGGASAIWTYCKNPAMTRYYRRWFGLEPIYTVLEKQL